MLHMVLLILFRSELLCFIKFQDKLAPVDQVAAAHCFMSLPLDIFFLSFYHVRTNG